jgi:hypothetical protein
VSQTIWHTVTDSLQTHLTVQSDGMRTGIPADVEG